MKFSTRARRGKSFACRKACRGSSMSFAIGHCSAPTRRNHDASIRRLIRQAAAEVHGEFERSPWVRRTAVAAGVVGVAIIAASIWSVTQREIQVPPIVVAEEAPVETSPEPEPIAVEPVVQEEPEAGPTLDEKLIMASDVTGMDYALAALFETWGLEYRTGGRSGCAQAADAGLACLYQRGSWSGLRQIDRPAILTLVDSDGNDHEVVLTGITDSNAELSLGGVRVTHAVADIRDAWFGESMLLWRPPTGTSGFAWTGISRQRRRVATQQPGSNRRALREYRCTVRTVRCRARATGKVIPARSPSRCRRPRWSANTDYYQFSARG